MSTVGYGDIVPTNASETIFVIFAMVLGAAVFGYVAGTVGFAVSEMSAPSIRQVR